MAAIEPLGLLTVDVPYRARLVGHGRKQKGLVLAPQAVDDQLRVEAFLTLLQRVAVVKAMLVISEDEI